jgi:uncharacterized protein
MRPLAALLLTLAMFVAAPPAASLAEHAVGEANPRGAVPPVDGYVPVGQGDKATLLRTQVEYPANRPATGVPTLLIYQGYTHKLDLVTGGYRFKGLFHHGDLRKWAAEQGYALMVVSVRGAGCSGGSYDFLSPQEAADGVDVINWITTAKKQTSLDDQPWSNAIDDKTWSNGKVAMIGGSYAGFQQLPVAARQPAGLVAIAPEVPIADLYRDVAYPGGISNTLLPAAFSAEVHTDLYPEAPHESLGSLAPSGDPNSGLNENRDQCIENQTGAPLGLTGTSSPLGLTGTSAGFIATHRWDDHEMRERAPGARIADIKVPTLAHVGWQDKVLGSRAIVDLPRIGGPFHAVLSNGDHDVGNSQRSRQRLQEFLDFYVRGIDNGFGARPPIEVWWESQRGPDPDIVPEKDKHADGYFDPDGSKGTRIGDVLPGWTSGLSKMPPAQGRETKLFLSEAGKLSFEGGTGGPDSYQYVGGSGQYRGGTLPEDWSAPPDSDRSLVYTSPPLKKDMAVLGSGSLDLWLDSTAPDTDVQAVLTEVRPEDGKEIYVQAGWLRASHRKLDDNRSTPTLPFHTHQAGDTQMLTPLKPELMRVEIRPFGHVFRAGSQLRVSIEAPPPATGYWSLESLPGPAINRVHHDSAYPSALKLETLPGQAAPVAYPGCGKVMAQPCRDARP